LPDGLFPNQKSPFGHILEASESKVLVNFAALWNVLQPLGMFNGQVGIFCNQLVIFCPFWYVAPRKILQPWLRA
jgi:hypothetical protein